MPPTGGAPNSTGDLYLTRLDTGNLDNGLTAGNLPRYAPAGHNAIPYLLYRPTTARILVEMITGAFLNFPDELRAARSKTSPGNLYYWVGLALGVSH